MLPQPTIDCNNGRFNEGNANGGLKGKGIGVGKDPKVCDNKTNKKQCMKDDSCVWANSVCSVATFPFLKEQAGFAEDPVTMQPVNSATQDATAAMKISAALFAGFFIAVVQVLN